MTLSGWQAVAVLTIGAALCVAGVVLGPAGAALIGVGGSIVGGILGMFTTRSPQARTRASDRRPTMPELVAPPWDPEKTPPPRSR